MFPNLCMELHKRRITIRMLHKMLKSAGVNISLFRLHRKMAGKDDFCFYEAEMIKNVINTDLPLEILFDRSL